jgi:hypothetical protein
MAAVTAPLTENVALHFRKTLPGLAPVSWRGEVLGSGYLI